MFFPVWRVLLGHNLEIEDFEKFSLWIYLIFTSISFYPQIRMNQSTKSVLGLSFDFVALNVTSFGCFFISLLVSRRNGDQSVLNRDLVYSGHALLCCWILAMQCIAFQNGTQKISWTAIFLTGSVWIAIITNVLLFLRSDETIQNFTIQFVWFRFFCSLLKYLPQAFYSYKRKSTSGWSKSYVQFDLIGYIFCIIHILVDTSISGSFSDNQILDLFVAFVFVIFDILFLLQINIWFPTKVLTRREQNRLKRNHEYKKPTVIRTNNDYHDDDDDDKNVKNKIQNKVKIARTSPLLFVFKILKYNKTISNSSSLFILSSSYPKRT
eukprot:c18036_g1_i1.p1 GENE.c18036_g1_i1~~c18036_g1_i1.p1  ORF type:complete len:323 (-),score=52.32 c18036_g1_i1:34-1002(-)